MKTAELHPAFGVTVTDVSLNALTDAQFDDIRALFEAHSLLLFPGQDLTDDSHIALANRFGPIEDRGTADLKRGPAFKVPVVSNIRKDGSVTGEMDMHTLNLKANMLWHADSTFLPIPALVNILTARVVTETGGNTEFASGRAAFAALPADMQEKLRGLSFWHHLSHSRAQISPELAKEEQFHKWPAQHWRAVWRNPVNGAEAIYVASHAYAVEGMGEEEGTALLVDLLDHLSQPQFVYSHKWREGDVLIWDQRAVLHRATPWNYQEPRKLSSICVSATSEDGVDAMRPIV